MKQFETLHVGDTLIYMGKRTLKVTAIKGDEATTRCSTNGLIETHSISHIKHCDTSIYKHIPQTNS